MTLKKDALIAVSLASVVLILAAGSTSISQLQSTRRDKSTSLVAQHPELLRAYVAYLSSKGKKSMGQLELELAPARQVSRDLYEGAKLKAPIDLMCASAILSSSSDPKDLALSHDLAVEALSRGILPARRFVQESDDRLLLSSGRPQRYGTQNYWNGKKLSRGPLPVTSDLNPREEVLNNGGSRSALSNSD